jgi:hypothetical protein
MITGTHIIFYSEKPDADRAFLRDILGFKSVDAGGGWLIFALPPAEAGVHPADHVSGESGRMLSADIYLMCDDLITEIKRLEAKKVRCAPVDTQRWGLRTTLRLPSGVELGLYQPTHPTAIEKKKPKPAKTVRKRKG